MPAIGVITGEECIGETDAVRADSFNKAKIDFGKKKLGALPPIRDNAVLTRITAAPRKHHRM